MTEEKVSTPAATSSVSAAPRRQFTATLTEEQYAYVKSLGRLGLSRLIQNIIDNDADLDFRREWVSALTKPEPKPWWRRIL